MTVLKMSVISAMTFLIAGCGGMDSCRERQPYEAAEVGKHVEAPEGLDPLNDSREMTIPEPSPRPPLPANAPCLEYPPSFHTEEPATESEPESETETEPEIEPESETETGAETDDG